MKAFVGKCTIMAYTMFLMCAAFAKAQTPSTTQQETSTAAVINQLTIDSTMDRTQLFALISRLRTQHNIDLRLTSYSRNRELIRKLGLQVTDATGQSMDFEAANSSGINSICIDVAASDRLARIGYCDDAVQSEENTSISNVVDATASDKAMTATRQQVVQRMQDSAAAVKEQRITARSDRQVQKNEARLQRLDSLQDQTVDQQVQLDSQRLAARAELKELDRLKKEQIKERKQLAFNNRRAKAVRDSLQQQQERLQQQLDAQQLKLEATKAQQEELTTTVQQQQRIIKSQGLQAETAQSLEAYRNALADPDGSDDMLRKGFLTFAGEQHSYQVYDGYTAVYDTLGKLLFILNKELGNGSIAETLKIKGEIYNYTYRDEVLIVTNNKGQSVNAYGETLQSEVVNPIRFEATDEFTISNQTTGIELQDMAAQMNVAGIDFMPLSIERDNKNELIFVSFKVNGEQYNIGDSENFPEIQIKIDRENLQAQVNTNEQNK
jgi:hypothetical protein